MTTESAGVPGRPNPTPGAPAAHLCHAIKIDEEGVADEGRYRVICSRCGWEDPTLRRSFAAAWQSMGRHLKFEQIAQEVNRT